MKELKAEQTRPEAGILPGRAAAPIGPATVRRLVEEHYDFIWRLICRLRVPRDEVDDATQQVFMVLVTKKDLVLAPGSERAFLFGVALRTTQEFRRRARIRGERDAMPAEQLANDGASAEELTHRLQARRMLDDVLESMPEAVRVAFILFELEGLTAREIAQLVGVPAGTVASRLRRGRELFERGVQNLERRLEEPRPALGRARRPQPVPGAVTS